MNDLFQKEPYSFMLSDDLTHNEWRLHMCLSLATLVRDNNARISEMLVHPEALVAPEGLIDSKGIIYSEALADSKISVNKQTKDTLQEARKPPFTATVFTTPLYISLVSMINFNICPSIYEAYRFFFYLREELGIICSVTVNWRIGEKVLSVYDLGYTKTEVQARGYTQENEWNIVFDRMMSEKYFQKGKTNKSGLSNEGSRSNDGDLGSNNREPGSNDQESSDSSSMESCDSSDVRSMESNNTGTPDVSYPFPMLDIFIQDITNPEGLHFLIDEYTRRWMKSSGQTIPYKKQRNILFQTIQNARELIQNDVFSLTETTFDKHPGFSFIYCLGFLWMLGYIEINEIRGYRSKGASNIPMLFYEDNGYFFLADDRAQDIMKAHKLKRIQDHTCTIEITEIFKQRLDTIGKITDLILDRLFDEEYLTFRVTKKNGVSYMLEGEKELVSDTTRFVELLKKYPHSEIRVKNYDGKAMKYEVKEKVRLDKGTKRGS